MATSVETIQSDEIKLFNFISNLIRTKIMIDVGAHHGNTLAPFLKNEWEVYAFEPVETNRNRIFEQFGDNKNLVLRSEAISNASTLKAFNLAVNNDGSLHEYYHSFENLENDYYHRKGETIEIQAFSINDLIKHGEIPKVIGFLKIDIEGHDLEALRGASNIECDAISVEFWCEQHTLGQSPSPPEAMIQLLAERGFSHFIIISHEGSYVTSYSYSSLESLSRRSWGNIIFYRDSQTELYEESVKFCKAIASEQASQKSASSIVSLVQNLFAEKPEFAFVDVGSHRGEMTTALLKHFPQAKAILFEPTPENYNFLKARFSHIQSIQIFNCALSNTEGKSQFYVASDSATNSLLNSNSSSTNQIQVSIQTLDNILQISEFETIDFIKIDTQGNDLKVLEGAAETIKIHSPAILVESIFVNLYQGQCSYYDIFSLMQSHQYCLAGFYNAHYTKAGAIAFSDLLFVPQSRFSQISRHDDQFICFDIDHLVSQNSILQSACDERLKLIHCLNETAAERLAIIEVLDAEVNRLKAEIANDIR
jgi:FkbM family methyltransferase